MASVSDKYIMVDGIRTHYLEAGDGPVVVLNHSGEFGACAEMSWEFQMEPLAEHFRVIAPDWLGMGRTDKLFDFVNGQGRRIEHMRRFLEVMDIKEADFMGNSMGAGMLARIAAAPKPLFPIRKLVLVAGGGLMPDSEGRQALMSYDTTLPTMKRVLWSLFENPKFYETDEAYIQRRQELSLIPGVWECSSAARFRSPAAPAPDRNAMAPDLNPLRNIKAPTFVVGGKQDRLLGPDFVKTLTELIPNSEGLEFDNCGHCPHIEYPDRFNAALIEFLKKEAKVPEAARA